MELFIQVLLIFLCFLVFMILGLYVWTNRDCFVLVPGWSPLGNILVDWAKYHLYPMPKEELVFYYNNIWPTYI